MSDRPLHRRLAKLAFALHPTRAHAQEAWPGLSIRRSGTDAGDVLWRSRPITSLVPLSALPREDAVTIAGSGPSMRGLDPGAITGLPILLNGAVSLAPRLGRTVMLAVEDERFVWRRFGMIEKATPDEAVCLFSVAVTRALCEVAPGWLDRRPVFLLDNLRKPYGAARRRLRVEDDPELLHGSADAVVSRQPGRGVVVAGTVALSALQVAIGLAPRRILLAGVDLGGSSGPRFYESGGDVAPSGLETGADRILAHFAAAADLARSRNIRLATITPGSALERLGVPYEAP